MGKWAKAHFGKEKFSSSVGIIVAGTAKEAYEEIILGFFDKVIHSDDVVMHTHLVRKGTKEYPIAFNVYGAPALIDVLSEMHDGGCRNVLFLGYAYGGFTNLDVGQIVLPKESYHFDGIYHIIDPKRKKSAPDEQLMEKLSSVFEQNHLQYVEGVNISVPSVTFQLPHANPDYQRIQPDTVEMELSACYARAHDIGIRAAGVLIISDNKTSSIGDKKEVRYLAKTKALKIVIGNLDEFEIETLKRDEDFSIDLHLASIVEDPQNPQNIYLQNHNGEK